jgi:hypothetical protein
VTVCLVTLLTVSSFAVFVRMMVVVVRNATFLCVGFLDVLNTNALEPPVKSSDVTTSCARKGKPLIKNADIKPKVKIHRRR